MTISDRRLDRYRLGELSPEESSELIRELEQRGELHRLADLEAEAEAFLEHYPPGPAVQHLRADLRRLAREPKAQKSSFSPWIAVAAIAACLLLFMIVPQPSPDPAISAVDVSAAPEESFITWSDSEVDCVGRVNCQQAALAAYKTGLELLDQADEDIANRYRAYAEFDRAEVMLERAGIAPLSEMADVREMKVTVKVELDQTFNQARVNYLNWSNRKMYQRMAEELTKLKTSFPDQRSLYHQWAVGKEQQMKDDRVYPASD